MNEFCSIEPEVYPGSYGHVTPFKVLPSSASLPMTLRTHGAAVSSYQLLVPFGVGRSSFMEALDKLQTSSGKAVRCT